MIFAVLSREAGAVLLGAIVGWVLGFLSDLARAEWDFRRQRKIAARLVYAELVVNMANVITLRTQGDWPTKGVRRSAWEAHGGALVYRASEERLVRVARAYSALDDIAYAAEDPRGRAELIGAPDYLDESLGIIGAGLNEAASLGEIRGAPDAVPDLEQVQ